MHVINYAYPLVLELEEMSGDLLSLTVIVECKESNMNIVINDFFFLFFKVYELNWFKISIIILLIYYG